MISQTSSVLFSCPRRRKSKSQISRNVPTVSRCVSTFVHFVGFRSGDKCYRKNPAHLQEYSHSGTSATTETKAVPVCPFGATCYRKNLLHFAEFNHPFNLLNPDQSDSEDEDEDEGEKKKTDEKITTTTSKKRKAESDDDGDKTEEYNSDDVRRAWMDER